MRSYLRALAAMLRSSPLNGFAFVADVLRALPHGHRRLRGELISWHATVRVWQDPELLAVLLADLDYSEIAEVFPPSEEQVRAAELEERRHQRSAERRSTFAFAGDRPQG